MDSPAINSLIRKGVLTSKSKPKKSRNMVSYHYKSMDKHNVSRTIDTSFRMATESKS